MIIHVADIPESGMTLRVEEPGALLSLGPEDEFCAAGSVTGELAAQVVDATLVVRGELSAPLEVPCARCRQKISTTVTDSGFLRDFPVSGESDTVEMDADLREAILLNLPRFPLCSEQCRGLCPRCGKNLNEGSCGCSEASDGGEWEMLNKLKL